MPEVNFNGPEGRLEGRFQQGKSPTAPIAVVLHPHPQHGGNMNNKITYAVYHCFVQHGFSVMRFNYRGVGRSQGQYDSGHGELADAAAALDWLQSQLSDASDCWVAGFSFGAWISMQLLMRRPEINGFIAVAPPAGLYDFTFLAPCPSAGLLLHGDKDEHVSHEEVEKLVEKLIAQRGLDIKYGLIRGANHFFEDKLEELTKSVSEHLSANVDYAPGDMPMETPPQSEE